MIVVEFLYFCDFVLSYIFLFFLSDVLIGCFFCYYCLFCVLILVFYFVIGVNIIMYNVDVILNIMIIDKLIYGLYFFESLMFNLIFYIVD